jgi:acyl-CoA synthetase (AMP-forming)/AMP-acid ligase II
VLTRYLLAAAEACGSKIAVSFEGRQLTFDELDERSNALAHVLRDRGLGPGMRAAVVLTNSPEFIVATNAVLRTGAAVITPMALGTLSELTHILDLTEPALIVAEAHSAGVLDGYSSGAVRLTIDDGCSDAWEPVRSRMDAGTSERVHVDVDEDAEAVLLLSSGTTGLPKAVRHSHRSLSATVGAWIEQSGLQADDTLQFFLPASTVFGLATLFASFAQQTSISMFRRFNLETMLEDIEQSRITVAMAAAPIAVAMANHPDIEKYDLSSLRYLVWGATPISKDVAMEVTRRTGVRWLHVYGLTEGGAPAANPVNEPDRWRMDSPGPIFHDCEYKFLLEDGTEAPPGTPGEFVIRSPQRMLGYLPPEANADVMLPDGWLRTGDIGYVADGWLFLVDRSKELIKVSGFSVSPVEIEKTLFSHPDIEDCGVYPVADDAVGQRPAAAVVRRAGSELDEVGLLSWTEGLMSSYKRLAKVTFVEAIPRNPSGKVLRRLLPEVVARSEPGG